MPSALSIIMALVGVVIFILFGVFFVVIRSAGQLYPKEESTKESRSDENPPDGIDPIATPKNKGLAYVLSAVLPGLGHLYMESVGDGVIILLLYSTAVAVSFFFPLVIVLAAVVWMGALVHAGNLADRYNQSLPAERPTSISQEAVGDTVKAQCPGCDNVERVTSEAQAHKCAACGDLFPL